MEVVGKYATATIYTDNIEEEAIKQIHDICDNSASEGNKIRIMPDVHAGKGIVIGYSSTLSKENPIINPSHVGVDIGCTVSMMRVSVPLSPDKHEAFEHKVKKAVPMGFAINDKCIIDQKKFFKLVRQEISRACATLPPISEYVDCNFNEKSLTSMLTRIGMDEGTFWKSVGTTGGGNHYMEYDEGSDGSAWLSVHCGSRNFGLKVARYWMKRAEHHTSIDSAAWKREIDNVKVSMPKEKWNEAIKKRREEILNAKPDGYLVGDDALGYLADMVIAQAYARFNHATILSAMLNIYKKLAVGAEEVQTVITTHNYIDFDDFIIRKGAVNAAKGRMLVIPMNMRDGSLICIGKGNPDWNCTAPHGAGRLMSRSAAKATLSLDEFKEEMKGICTSSVDMSTIDESPMAYKPMEEIVSLIEPTVDIIDIVKPKINWKASE